jgi:adenosylhomocysteinase
LLAGKTLVVAGYGWRARGIATRAIGMGANVVVTEINALRALEAVMDGYRVLPMIKAASIGDIFVTASGGNQVLDQQHFVKMKDGAIVANSGQFDIEANVAALDSMATAKELVRPNATEYLMQDGRHISVLGAGRLVNLSAAEGHPSAVMDMSFAVQALCVEYLAMHGKALPPAVHTVPADIDNMVAGLKLHAMGIEIDKATTASG